MTERAADGGSGSDGGAGGWATGLAAELDRITVTQLRAAGSVKWTAYPDTIAAWVAEMDYGVAPEIGDALADTIQAGMLGYVPPWLQRKASAACSGWLRDRYGWEVPPVRVRPVADVLNALEATITHFSRPGSPVILPTPAYMPFLDVPGALGREVLTVPLIADAGRYGYDLDALDAAFAAGGNLLVLVNPHNPTGRVMTRPELTAISAVVERHGGRVFADEIHAPLVYPGHEHVPYASLDPVTASHTVTAVSTSKAWNIPGLKCAHLVLSNDEDAAHWRSVGGFVEHLTSTVGLVGAVAAYDHARTWQAQVLDYLDGNRRLMVDLVAEHLGTDFAPPEGTYLAWLDVRRLGLANPAAFFRDRAGVALTDGAACGDAGRGFVRFNLAMPRPVLTRAVEQMGAALRAR
ncbi:MAG: MalY/PatB family protein [Cellulomonadaceae bacterium]